MTKNNYTSHECLLCGKMIKVGEEVYELKYGDFKTDSDDCTSFEPASSVSIHGYEHLICKLEDDAKKELENE